MESFNFELKLISDVDRVANRGADGLKRLQGQGKKTQEALDFHKQIGRSEQQLARLNKDPAGFIKFKRMEKERAEQQNKLLEGAGLKKSESFLSGLTSKLNFSRIAGAAAVGDIIGEGVIKAGETLLEMAHGFVDIVQEGLKKAFDEGGKEEKRKRQFGLSLGGKEGKEALGDADRFAKLTKFTPEQIAPMLLKLRSAGFNQKSARQTIATGSDIEAAGGMSAQEYAEFAERLKLKGGVSTKQLVGAGINAPQFYKDLGKKLGIGAETAEKRASEGGKIDTQLMLNMITEAVNKKQGGAAGTGGNKEAQGFEARYAKLVDLPNQYAKKLDDMPGFKRVEELFGGLLEKLDPESPTGQRIQSALESMFDKITAFVGDPADAADKIADGLDRAISIADQLLPSLKEVGEVMFNIADTAARWVTNIRLAQAYLTHDTQTVDRINKEESDREGERNFRVITSQKMKEREATDAGTYAGRLAGGVNPMVASLAYATDVDNSKKAISKVIQLHVHPGAVVVHGAHGDDSDKAAREAGDKVRRHITSALEKAAQEGGG